MSRSLVRISRSRCPPASISSQPRRWSTAKGIPTSPGAHVAIAAVRPASKRSGRHTALKKTAPRSVGRRITVDHDRTWNWSGFPVTWISRSARLTFGPCERARAPRTPSPLDRDHARNASGLRGSWSHEELKPDQSLVKLAQLLAVPVVVQPDAFEQRSFEILERPEVIAVGGRDLGDECTRLARPRVDAAK